METKKETLPAARTAGRVDKKNRTVNPFKTSADILFGNDTSTEAIEQAKILIPDSEIGLTLELAADCAARFEKIEAADGEELYFLGRDQVRDSGRYKNFAFLIRTRVAYELGLDRRLPGGSGKHDDLRQGRLAAYQEVADWSGLNRKKIEEDVRIFRVFLVEPLAEITDVETLRGKRIELLKMFLRYDRELFKVALSAADPQQAFEEAVMQIEDAIATGGKRYSAAQFKRDLEADKSLDQDIQSGSAAAASGNVQLHDCCTRIVFVECFLTVEEKDFLDFIMNSEKFSLDAAIGRAISAFAETVVTKGGEND